MAAPQCTKCSQFNLNHTCEAFPCGIPDEIFLGAFDHRMPYPGDNGIRLQKISEHKSAGSRLEENSIGEGGIGELIIDTRLRVVIAKWEQLELPFI